MTKAQSDYFEILEGYPHDTIAISAIGRITAQDYETVLVPLVKARIKAVGKVKLLYMLGPQFESMSMGAAWDDAKLGLTHIAKIARIAVVTDRDWIRFGITLAAPLIACPVRVFPVGEFAAAKEWITASGNEAQHKPGVAANHKLSLMEDMLPPKP